MRNYRIRKGKLLEYSLQAESPKPQHCERRSKLMRRNLRKNKSSLKAVLQTSAAKLSQKYIKGEDLK